MELFPIIQPEFVDVSDDLPLYREVAWNFREGKPMFQNGNPVFTIGLEAVKVWIWKALITQRTLYPIYTWDFGNEVETLLGQNFAEATKSAEATRYIRESLEINPYITEVSNINISFAGSLLSIEVTASTVYGEVDVLVRR